MLKWLRHTNALANKFQLSRYHWKKIFYGILPRLGFKINHYLKFCHFSPNSHPEKQAKILNKAHDSENNFQDNFQGYFFTNCVIYACSCELTLTSKIIIIVDQKDGRLLDRAISRFYIIKSKVCLFDVCLFKISSCISVFTKFCLSKQLLPHLGPK